MESLIVDGQEVQLTIIKDYNVTVCFLLEGGGWQQSDTFTFLTIIKSGIFNLVKGKSGIFSLLTISSPAFSVWLRGVRYFQSVD